MYVGMWIYYVDIYKTCGYSMWIPIERMTFYYTYKNISIQNIERHTFYRYPRTHVYWYVDIVCGHTHVCGYVDTVRGRGYL